MQFDMNNLDSFLARFIDTTTLSSRQYSAIKLVISSINPDYLRYVLMEFESSCIFETKKIYFNHLLEKLQDAILKIAQNQAKNARLKSEEFVSSYEERILKTIYFTNQIIDTKNPQLKAFVSELMQKIAQ